MTLPLVACMWWLRCLEGRNQWLLQWCREEVVCAGVNKEELYRWLGRQVGEGVGCSACCRRAQVWALQWVWRLMCVGVEVQWK